MIYDELPVLWIMIFSGYTVWNYRCVFKWFWLILSGEGKGATFILVSHFLKHQYNQWVTIKMSLSGSDQI